MPKTRLSLQLLEDKKHSENILLRFFVMAEEFPIFVENFADFTVSCFSRGDG